MAVAVTQRETHRTTYLTMTLACMCVCSIKMALFSCMVSLFLYLPSVCARQSHCVSRASVLNLDSICRAFSVCFALL